MGTAASHDDRAVLALGCVSIAGSAGAWTGTLDIGGNDLIVHNADSAAASATVTMLTNLAHAGLNLGSGWWNGTGLISSTAAADPMQIRGIGIRMNDNGFGGAMYGAGSPKGLFALQDVINTDVLVCSTFLGDADLSGSVDAADYSEVDNGYAMGLSGWSNGDVNYDGTLNAADYSLIDYAYAMQGTPLSASAMAATPVPRDTTFQPVLAAPRSQSAPSAISSSPFADQPLGDMNDLLA
jgi:hypothetical protein